MPMFCSYVLSSLSLPYIYNTFIPILFIHTLTAFLLHSLSTSPPSSLQNPTLHSTGPCTFPSAFAFCFSINCNQSFANTIRHRIIVNSTIRVFITNFSLIIPSTSVSSFSYFVFERTLLN